MRNGRKGRGVGVSERRVTAVSGHHNIRLKATDEGTVRGLELRGDADARWWLSAIVMLFIISATMIGNMVVIVAMWRLKRVASHYPLTSLVLADLLVGVAVQPIAAARELFVFKLNISICGFWSTLDVLCCTASILSLCALGWERWSGITAPLARLRRARKARMLAYCVWPTSTLVALPTSFVPSPHHFHPGETEKACVVNVNTWYVLFSVTISFYLPVVVMVTMYACILRALSAPPPVRAHRGRSPRPAPQTAPGETNNNNNLTQISTRGSRLTKPETSATCPDTPTKASKRTAHETHIRRQRRATRTIVTLMALFLVCWTPYFIILPLDSVFDCVWESTWLWCTWLGYANSAFNPLVYAATLRAAAANSRSSTSKNLDGRKIDVITEWRKETD